MSGVGEDKADRCDAAVTKLSTVSSQRRAHTGRHKALARTRTRRMQPVFHSALRLLIRLRPLTICASSMAAPRPVDAPYAYVAGPGPDQVLLLGSDMAAGCGVLTHQLGLVGHISRQLSDITGRGVELEACAEAGITLNKLVECIQNLPPVRPGAVMVIVGVNDALRLTSARAWRQDLQTLLDVIRGADAQGIHTLVIGIPPLDAFGTLAPLRQRVIAQHARLLNETSKRLCHNLTQVTFVPFLPAEPDRGPACGSSEAYQNQSRDFVVPLAAALHCAVTSRGVV